MDEPTFAEPELQIFPQTAPSKDNPQLVTV